MDNIKDVGGRPRKFESPEHLEKLFFDYIDYCDARQDMPNIAGFCVFLARVKDIKIHRESYYAYKDYDGFSNTIKGIDEAIENAVINCKYQKDLMKIAYLNNKCGYSQKVENVNTNINTEITNLTSEQRKAKIAELTKQLAED